MQNISVGALRLAGSQGLMIVLCPLPSVERTFSEVRVSRLSKARRLGRHCLRTWLRTWPWSRISISLMENIDLRNVASVVVKK